MTLTVSKVRSQDIGNGERVVADVTFDNSYPHGGEPLTAADLGFRVGSKLDQVDVPNKGNYVFEWVPDATLADRGKLVVRRLKPNRQDYLTTEPVLAIGSGSKAKVLITNVSVYIAGGAVVELASSEIAFTATTHDITANVSLIQEAYYLLSTADGVTVTITKGTTAGEDAAVPPAAPANHALIGLVKVQVAAGATDFNATTDLLDASHLTTTFEDLSGQVYQAEDLSSLSARVTATGR